MQSWLSHLLDSAVAEWSRNTCASLLDYRVRVGAVEGHPCGQFSYPTLQYVPEGGRIFVAYTVLFLPSKMPPDCRVRANVAISLPPLMC